MVGGGRGRNRAHKIKRRREDKMVCRQVGKVWGEKIKESASVRERRQIGGNKKFIPDVKMKRTNASVRKGRKKAESRGRVGSEGWRGKVACTFCAGRRAGWVRRSWTLLSRMSRHFYQLRDNLAE